MQEEFELQHFRRHLTSATTSLHMNNYREDAASDTGAENLSPMEFSGGHVADEHPQFENDELLHALKLQGMQCLAICALLPNYKTKKKLHCNLHQVLIVILRFLATGLFATSRMLPFESLQLR